jgi:hypothetical protein
MGAIRSGKIKSDDPNLPQSVKDIIKRMKEKGVDPATADPKEIKKYLKEHPKELDEVRKAAKTDIIKDAGLTEQQKNDKNRQAESEAAKAGPKPKTSDKSPPKEKTSSLGL